MAVYLLAAFLAAPLGAAPLRITDDSGSTLLFATSPQRIISLAPNLTELAYAAGLGGKLVAVTAYSDYPPEAKLLPQVGDAFRLDWERLLALKPDLVLGWQSGLSARDRAMFGKLGIKLLVLEPHRLQDIPETVRALGRLAESPVQAETAARDLEQQQQALARRYAQRPEVRVWLQVAAAPLLTVNGRHILSDVLRLCGARNVFADQPLLTAAVSVEALVAARPQLLLALADGPQQETAIRRDWARLAPGVPTGFLSPDLLSRAGPRLLQGAASVCRQVEQVRSPVPIP
ncbi:cobalamin-binding protein [Ferriphaselus sp. R-1]|uniref:cobalamin-binding protein n=1 Tax=Ferriphaselus sp. R-1 TaxID=1485544 RepID=UPI000AB5B2CE|nr:cobalamin-binding protein [Ferriphaselus sp. R-1]